MTKTAVASAARTLDAERCSGKWSRCGGRNPRMKPSWGLCGPCTAARDRDKRLGRTPPVHAPTPGQVARVEAVRGGTPEAPHLKRRRAPESWTDDDPEMLAAWVRRTAREIEERDRHDMLMFVLEADGEAFARIERERAERDAAEVRMTDAQRTLAYRNAAVPAIKRVAS